MAETKNETKKAERVSITLPRAAAGADPTMFVAVNGVTYLIPKGKKTEVPREVYEEIVRSQKAEDKFYETVAARQADAKQL